MENTAMCGTWLKGIKSKNKDKNSAKLREENKERLWMNLDGNVIPDIPQPLLCDIRCNLT